MCPWGNAQSGPQPCERCLTGRVGARSRQAGPVRWRGSGDAPAWPSGHLPWLCHWHAGPEPSEPCKTPGNPLTMRRSWRGEEGGGGWWGKGEGGIRLYPQKLTATTLLQLSLTVRSRSLQKGAPRASKREANGCILIHPHSADWILRQKPRTDLCAADCKPAADAQT